jgi:redox-sensing transcriptional repressor
MSREAGERRLRGPCAVPKPAIARLPLYLRQCEAFVRSAHGVVSSRQLGQALGLTDAQVRKDLAYFGQFGRRGQGYDCEALSQTIRRILGTDRRWPVALVGMGNLGRALFRYRGFRRQGFEVVAIYDADPQKVGQVVDGVTIEPLVALPRSIRERQVRLAIIAVPADAAQMVADQLAGAGVEGILNFAPALLHVPPHVRLIAVDLTTQLENLAFQVLHGDVDAPDD